MSGSFGFIVSSIFVFILLITIFVGSFVLYSEGLTNKADVIHSLSTKENNIFKSNYNISLPYYISGRLSFFINNTGLNNIILKSGNNFIFDIFLNNKLFTASNLFFNLANKPLLGDYYLLKPGKGGIFTLEGNYNFLNNYKLMVVSSSGISSFLNLNKSTIDWWNYNWKNRKIINVTNLANHGLTDYQVELDFNRSNIDFNKATYNNIRFELPLTEDLVLDVNFDNYSQILEDYSKVHNFVYLGNTTGVDSSDPLPTKGVIFSGLKFDGVTDFVTVASNPNLQLDREITIATWVKWNGHGETLQNIYTNGGWGNALRIVDDGSLNNRSILFQLNINGVVHYLYSHYKLDTKWHFITATYDGEYMKIYVDGKLDSSLKVIGNIVPYSGENLIGSEFSNYYFNGSLDELKVFDVALTASEVKDLYYNKLRFRNLDFYIARWDYIHNQGVIFVKIPSLRASSTISIHMYYNSKGYVNTNSNIVSTFTYNVPKIIGYVVSSKMANLDGILVTSLASNNTVVVGNSTYNLGFLGSETVPAANISINTSVATTKLIQAEGKGNTEDIIVPISWAGTKFFYNGFRDSKDNFCMMSPWGNANVKIYDKGVLNWSGTVTGAGYCYQTNFGSTDNVAILSDIPILVYYYGGSGDDSFAFYPASKTLYGVPSKYVYFAVNSSGGVVSWILSNGVAGSKSLGSYGTSYVSGFASEGAGPAMYLFSNSEMGAIQQADSDGVESTTFAPQKEMGTLFGSDFDLEYLAIASPFGDADCRVYNSTALVAEQVYGNGGNGIYKYFFGNTNNQDYVVGPWYVNCSKPVWLYYEKHLYGDETNLLGYLQMRQFTYPSPEVVIG